MKSRKLPVAAFRRKPSEPGYAARGYLHAAGVDCETVFVNAAKTAGNIKISARPAVFDSAAGKPLFFHTAFTAAFTKSFPFCEREISFFHFPMRVSVSILNP
jgi:hypothetical protein